MAVGATGNSTVGQVAATAPPPAAPQTSAANYARQAAQQALGPQVPAGNYVPSANAPAGPPAPGSRSDFNSDAAEDAVRANAGHQAGTDFGTLGDVNARKAFVSNITQLDGSRGGNDESSCGPTALIAGITMADPKATQKLAGGILSQSFNEHNKMFSQPLGEENIEALKRIRDGNASPADAQRLAQVMATSKGVKISDGATVDEMGTMVGNATKLLGDSMPNMSVHMYADAKDPQAGAHWQAYANGVEIDPWPNAQGKSTITDGAAGLGQGASHYQNGTVHTKMIVENHGKNITVPRYLATAPDGSRVANDNVNVPLTNYRYDQNTFGYGYTRVAGTVPANVDPSTEPDAKLNNYA